MNSNYTGLTLNQVRVITRQILEGLSYLHDSRFIIHTDLKPENVLVEMSPIEIRDMAQGKLDNFKSKIINFRHDHEDQRRNKSGHYGSLQYAGNFKIAFLKLNYLARNGEDHEKSEKEVAETQKEAKRATRKTAT